MPGFIINCLILEMSLNFSGLLPSLQIKCRECEHGYLLEHQHSVALGNYNKCTELFCHKMTKVP